MMLVCLASGRDEHVVQTDGTVDRWASGQDDTSSGRLTGNLKSSIFFIVQSLIKMLWQVESLFTASLHINDFVQTQNEAKILTEAMSRTATWMGGGGGCGASSRSSRLSWALDFISVCLLMGSWIFIFGYLVTLMPDCKIIWVMMLIVIYELWECMRLRKEIWFTSLMMCHGFHVMICEVWKWNVVEQCMILKEKIRWFYRISMSINTNEKSA